MTLRSWIPEPPVQEPLLRCVADWLFLQDSADSFKKQCQRPLHP